MDEQILKPIPEANYLVAVNAWRYRAILRYFYLQHEKLRYYLFPEEIFEHLTSKHYFTDYTEEQLEQDLNQLVEWKNLIPRQDAGKVTTIQEFKKEVSLSMHPLYCGIRKNDSGIREERGFFWRFFREKSV